MIRNCSLVYYGTGNPGSGVPPTRCGEPITQANCNTGKWDNKWSMTIFARKVDTGEVVWAYQMTPFDQWDYDGVNEIILVDLPNVDGKPRKAWCILIATASPTSSTALTATCCAPIST